MCIRDRYNPLVAGMIVLIFLPSAWLYYSVVRRRLARLGAEENRAQRRKARTGADLLRGYADMEVAGAFPAMLDVYKRQATPRSGRGPRRRRRDARAYPPHGLSLIHI